MQHLLCAAQSDSLKNVILFDNDNMTISNPVYKKGKVVFFAAQQDTSKPCSILMIEMDTCGNIISNKTVATIDTARRLLLSDIDTRETLINTKDGGVLLTGRYSSRPYSPFYWGQFWLKLDSLGKQEFFLVDKIYVGEKQNPIFVKETNDGFITAGSFTYHTDTPDASECYAAKISKNGTRLWRGEYLWDIPTSFEILNDTTYQMMNFGCEIGQFNNEGFTGKFMYNFEFGKHHNISILGNRNKWYFDYFTSNKDSLNYGISCHNDSLQTIWEAKGNTIYNKNDGDISAIPTGLQKINDKLYLFTTTSLNWVKTYSSFAGIHVFDTLGHFIWSSQDTISKKNITEKYVGLIQLESGNLFALGIKLSYWFNDKAEKAWFSKFNTNGKFVQKCKTIIATKEESNFANVRVFPNPGTDSFSIICANNEQCNADEIFIFDILGNQVARQQIQGNISNFDSSTWQKGLYFYTIYQKNSLVTQGKWLKLN